MTERAWTTYRTASPSERALGLVVDRIKTQYGEAPALALTPRQAARLLELDERVCEGLLEGLVASEFLYRGPAGRFYCSHII